MGSIVPIPRRDRFSGNCPFDRNDVKRIGPTDEPHTRTFEGQCRLGKRCKMDPSGEITGTVDAPGANRQTVMGNAARQVRAECDGR